MDQFKQLLFNPNHEMPSGTVLIAIVVISLLTSVLTNYLKNRSTSNRSRDEKQDRNKRGKK